MKLFIKLFVQKRIMQYFILDQSERIVVASTGRAGSTLLVEAISAAYVKKKFIRLPQVLRRYLAKCVSEFVVNICDVTEKHAPILKTHDLYNPEIFKTFKCVFIYGDPLESALSCKRLGQEFTKMHIKHLKGAGHPSDIFQKDVLNYKKQLRSWQFAKNTLHIDYRKLWECQDELSDFLDLPISLPKQQKRSVPNTPVTYNAELFDSLKEYYQAFPNLK